MAAAPQVLVAYSTRNGSTAEIAEWIGEALRHERLGADVVRIDGVQGLDPARYDAVVLGAPVYVGRWNPSATRFARRHHRALSRRPLWLFSSGPLDSSASEGKVMPPRGVRRLARRLGAEEPCAFGGRLVEGAQGYLARQMLRQNMGGDFRDQDQVKEWARGIAGGLLSIRETTI